MRDIPRFDVGVVKDSVLIDVPAGSTAKGNDLTALIQRSLEKPYSIQLDLMSSGHVNVTKEGIRINSPVSTAPLIVSAARRNNEVLVRINQTLEHWGFTDYRPLSTDEQVTAEESTYSCPDPKFAAEVCARLFDAQMPFASTLFNRMDDGYYAGLEVEAMFLDTPEFWRAPDVDSLVMSAFGFRRKDLVKLVLSSRPHLTNWVAMFAPYLTEDQVVRAFRMLDSGEARPIPGMVQNIVDTVLSSLTHPTTRFNLAINRDRWAQDMYFENGDFAMSGPGVDKVFSNRKLRGWGDVSRESMFEYSRQSESQGIKAEPWLDTLREKTIGRFTLCPLTNAVELVQTGDGMSVCVGRINYLEKVLAGSSVLVRLDTEDEGMTALVDFARCSDGTLEVCEVKGDHNTEPPSDLDVDALLAMVNTAEVEHTHHATNERRDNDAVSEQPCAA